MPHQKKQPAPNIWVVRAGKRYSIREEKRRDLLIAPVSQRVAIEIARQIARAYGSELIVQGAGGRIRARDSHGADRFPPRG